MAQVARVPDCTRRSTTAPLRCAARPRVHPGGPPAPGDGPARSGPHRRSGAWGPGAPGAPSSGAMRRSRSGAARCRPRPAPRPGCLRCRSGSPPGLRARGRAGYHCRVERVEGAVHAHQPYTVVGAEQRMACLSALIRLAGLAGCRGIRCDALVTQRIAASAAIGDACDAAPAARLPCPTGSAGCGRSGRSRHAGHGRPIRPSAGIPMPAHLHRPHPARRSRSPGLCAAPPARATSAVAAPRAAVRQAWRMGPWSQPCPHPRNSHRSSLLLCSACPGCKGSSNVIARPDASKSTARSSCSTNRSSSGSFHPYPSSPHAAPCSAFT